MIALITGFAVYFLMKHKIHCIVFYYESILTDINMKIKETHRDVQDINKSLDKYMLLDDIAKLIEQKQKKNKRRF